MVWVTLFGARISIVFTLEQGQAMDKGDQGLCFDPWWIRAHLGGFSRCWAIQAALFAFWVVFFV